MARHRKRAPVPVGSQRISPSLAHTGVQARRAAQADQDLAKRLSGSLRGDRLGRLGVRPAVGVADYTSATTVAEAQVELRAAFNALQAAHLELQGAHNALLASLRQRGLLDGGPR